MVVNEICDKSFCTACYSCYNSCSANCIEMKLDEDGCIRPHIDSDRCIGCAQCQKHCPVNNMPEFNSVKRTIAAFSKNADINKSSTSGGIATLLSLDAVRKGGIVFSSRITDELSVEMNRCDNESDVLLSQGSKYVHSHVNDSFRKIKNDLESGKEILAISTPCQISGLKAFLQKNYEKLYTVDIICHGTPDQNTFLEYTKNEFKDEISRVCDVKFRDSTPFITGINYILEYFDKDKKLLKYLPVRISSYYWCFLYGYSFRENCYHCMYAKKDRVSDITLGDFWGFDDKKFMKKKNSGISLVLINTEKGQQLFDRIKANLEYTESRLDKAIAGNHHLSAPEKFGVEAQLFKKLSTEKGVVYALEHCDEKTYKLSKIRKFVYNHKALLGFLVKIPIIKEKL